MTITCFAASYLLSLLLEAARFAFQVRLRPWWLVVCTAAGLLAHTLFLGGQLRRQAEDGVYVTPLSSWHDFCLVAAWVLAAAYFGLLLRRPTNSTGLFLLPLVLALIAAAYFFRGLPSFQPSTALGVWRIVHGTALALGTAAVTLGFGTGLMYLVQASRLKRKLPPKQGFQLPSLESLQRFNRESLMTSTCLLAAGLLSGVVLNLGQTAGSGRGVTWTDPVVLSSAILFCWLLAVVLFEATYKPARQGRKVAYLTLASFLFLMMALGFVLLGEHAAAPDTLDASALRILSRGAPV